MDFFDIIAILLCLSALFSYLNHRFLHLPTAIGLMVIALALSASLILLDYLGWEVREHAERILERIDFNETLLHGMLGLLLFAGALHIDLGDLARQKWVITSLATAGILISTTIIGLSSWAMLRAVGMPLTLLECLLFGALISPTDPIAVLGILKTSGVPKTLETKITGESLFNDGIGVVVFLVLLHVYTGHESISPGGVAVLFAQETVGGVLLGLAGGLVAYGMLKSVDNYQVEVLLTLAMVTGGYALAEALHVSAPLAAVTSGLLIGNHGRAFAMSEKTREHLDSFWELIDEVLNGVLFVLIGLEVLVIAFDMQLLTAGMLAVPIVLLARAIAVAIPINLLRLRRPFSPHVVKMMTWGGLRGGISVALALALPKDSLDQESARTVLVAITYCVVVFSIVVQGLTISALVRRLYPAAGKPETPSASGGDLP